jgi:lipopolysaccharide biosynthesis glycosyltransferase
MLINTKKFREDSVLDQFINLLGVYRFQVTQDEDYLNVICNHKVLWIDNSWNVEIYGEIKYKDEDINMTHYIKWGKPWHIKNGPLGEHFWKYAIMTPGYDEIKEFQENYKEVQVLRDMEQAKILEALAISESLRSDSYYKLLQKG